MVCRRIALNVSWYFLTKRLHTQWVSWLWIGANLPLQMCHDINLPWDYIREELVDYDLEQVCLYKCVLILTYPATQWAAVTTQCGCTNVAPQTCLRAHESWRETTHGQRPWRAGRPPTIMLVTDTPHSAETNAASWQNTINVIYWHLVLWTSYISFEYEQHHIWVRSASHSGI